MPTISVNLPSEMIADLEKVCELGRFESRAEAIRAALRDFIMKYRVKPNAEAV